MSAEHPNSRYVTIMQSGTFLSRAQGAEADDMFKESNVSIGSYFESSNSPRVASGLTFEEEALLLPILIDAPKDDREFRKKVSDYYENISTRIPYETGLRLEIGLESDNNTPVGKNNMPIAVADYLRYRHAIKHPEVALTKEAAAGNRLKRFYVFDPSQITVKNKKLTQEKDAAIQIYLEVSKEMEKVDMMLTLLGIDIREFSGNTAGDLKIETLRTQAETRPAKFIAAYQEDNMEVRYWIESMVTYGIVRVVGTRYMITETKKILGNTLEETIYFFLDEENSDTVVMLKALVQEARSKPVKPGTKHRKTILNTPK